MKSKMSKKGFTLIELLAVLVILAILALITIPIVLSIIRNARENSYARSVETYGRAVETAVMEYQMNNEGEGKDQISFYKDYIKISKNQVECNDDFTWENDSIKLMGCKVKGSKSDVTYTYYNGRATKVDGQESTSYTAYSVGDIPVEGYHVIADSPSNKPYVTLLKDEALTENEVNEYGGVGTGDNHVNKYAAFTQKKSGTFNGAGVMNFYSSVTCGFVNDSFIETGCTNDYQESDIKKVIDAWANSLDFDLIDDENGYKARLITFQELMDNLGCNSNDCSNSPYNWIYNVNIWREYWTMTPVENFPEKVMVFSNDGHIYKDPVYSSTSGPGQFVRPVINVKKLAIQE